MKPFKEKLIMMATVVEEMLGLSMKALMQHESAPARKAITMDKKLGQLEVTLDKIGRKRLQQPIKPEEISLITTGLKVSRDLERIGDLVVNLAERALELNEQPQLKPYIELPKMATTVQKMIHQATEAFCNEETGKSKAVYETYKGIAQWRRQIFFDLLEFMIKDPTTVARSIRLISIARYLERIGDHAANMAELVIYNATGKMIRT
ncbi:MAG: phosphate signaling complex protein PhoU [Deltaproteobacteria bacterium]|nr:phosphate signaling complex protein PhoU [Deltaproteobacteria bacterium]